MKYYIKLYSDGNFASRFCYSKESCEHAEKEGYKQITASEFVTIYKVISRFFNPENSEIF